MSGHRPLEPGYRFPTDLAPEGCLHAAVLRSPHAHARIERIDTAAARTLPGVAAVITADDVPGRNLFGLRFLDQPVLCPDKVRCVGDPVAAVAAATPEQARAACRAIAVDYTLLPVVGDVDAALAPGAVALHAGGNLLHRTFFARGDLEAAFALCAHIVEDSYETPRQMPGFLETESALAEPDGVGGLVVRAPGHHAERERQELARILALDPAGLRVIASPAGGSYGGKDELHAQPIAALLALVTGRPVRLRWSRAESVAIGVKRHPFRIRMRTGCAEDGRLLAHAVELTADTGAYAQHGPEVLDTAHENCQGPYLILAVRLEGRLVYTNNGVAGAMRGFGALQAQLALEQQIDRLARAAGLDPLDFRRRNLRPNAAPGQLGQTLAAPAWADRALHRLIMRRGRVACCAGRWLRGVGWALVEKGEGFARGGPNGGRGRLALGADGRIEVRLGMSELGQGMERAATAAAVRLLGCDPAEVRAVLGDTAATPDTGPVAANRGTGMLARILRAAAPDFARQLLAAAAARLDLPCRALRLGPGGVWLAGAGANAPLLPFTALAGEGIAVEAEVPGIETETGEGAVHAAFVACGAEVVVRVDRHTGRVAVERVRLVPVTGPVLVPASVRGQMEGSVGMAVGIIGCERLPAQDGRFPATNLDGYLMPTILDAPEVEVEPIEDLPPDALGPRGIAEIGLNASAPAIVNAVTAATGYVARRLPIDPADLLAHLERRPCASP